MSQYPAWARNEFVPKTYSEFSLVDAGACEGADIIIAKRKDPTPAGSGESVDVAAAKAAAPELLFKLKAEFIALKAGRTISAANVARLQVIADQLQALLGQSSTSNPQEDDMSEKSFDISKLDAPAQEHIKAIEKRATDAETAQKADADKLAELTAKVAELETKAATPEDAEKAALAALPESVRKRLEETEKRAKDTETALKAEQDARTIEKSAARVEKDYAGLPIGKALEFGAIMKRAADVMKAEEFAEIDRVLKAAAAIAQKSGEYKPIGSDNDGAGGATAVDLINAKARELVTKGDFKTFEQAWTHVSKNDATLRTALKRERAQAN